MTTPPPPTPAHTPDIVTRLRDKKKHWTEVQLEAADTIARLARERDEARADRDGLGMALGKCAALTDDLTKSRDLLRAEVKAWRAHDAAVILLDNSNDDSAALAVEGYENACTSVATARAATDAANALGETR